MSGIQGMVMAIVGVAVVLAVGLIVLGELKTTADGTCVNSTVSGIYNSTGGTGAGPYGYCADGTLYANTGGGATGTVINKLATVPTWIGILITVALAFIVLGYFYSRRG